MGVENSNEKFDNKSIVFGVVERNGFAKAKHVKTTGARVLLKEIKTDVKRGAHIHTDEWRSYK